VTVLRQNQAPRTIERRGTRAVLSLIVRGFKTKRRISTVNQRRIWSLIALAAILLGMLPAMALAQDGEKAAPAQSQGTDKIEAQLLDLFAVKESGDFIVRFTEQADLSPAYKMDWQERGEFVYNTLKETAGRSQAAAKELLDKQGFK